MAILRIARFTADPENTELLLTRRAALIEAVRAKFPGLTDTRLARLDEERWVDVWHWESASHVEAAAAGAPSLPETAPAFSLTRDLTAEQAEVIDAR